MNAARKTTSSAEGRRQQRREEHQRLSRDQLLDAAEEVFGAKGYHETSLKEVAELAEFSVGSVYTFFENKDDLFQQIFLRRGEEYLPRLSAVLASDNPADQVLHDLIDFECGYFRDHKHFARLYLRYWGALPSSERVSDVQVSGRYQEAMGMQSELFRRGQAEGLFRGGDPDALSRLFSGMVAAFQAIDPAVISDDADEAERMSLDELHDLVARAFAA